MNILELKAEIDKRKTIIDVSQKEVDELIEKVDELETEIIHCETAVIQLERTLRSEISALAATKSGNDFIDALRKTFPYINFDGIAPRVHRISYVYLVTHNSIIGTNSIVIFEVLVDNVPAELIGKYLLSGVAIEPDKVTDYVVDQIDGDYDADKLKSMMDKFFKPLDKSVSLDSVSELFASDTTEGYGKTLVSFVLKKEKLVFDYDILKNLVNIFTGPVTVYGRKKHDPICIKDERNTVFIAPIKQTPTYP